MALPKQNRIKKSRELSELFATRPAASEHFTLRASRDPHRRSHKLSVLISSKIVGRAVARNTLRRKTIAAVARIIRTHAVVPGVSAAISLKRSSIPEPHDLERELLSLMIKSGILNT